MTAQWNITLIASVANSSAFPIHDSRFLLHSVSWFDGLSLYGGARLLKEAVKES